jgi:hypothetical protein
MIVNNSEDEWFNALDFLLSHELERGVMRWAAYTNFRTNHLLKQVNIARVKSLHQVLGQESNRVAIGM